MIDNHTEEMQPLILDAEGSYNMQQVARWGKFLAVTGMVFLGLMLLFVVFMSFVMFGVIGSSDAGANALAAGFSIVYAFMMLVVLAIYIYPIYALYKFSVQSKLAINTKHQQLFNSSLRHLKGLFMFMGIFTLVIVCIYAITFLFMFAVGGLAAMAR